MALQIAEGVEPELLELGGPRQRPGPPERLEEVRQRRGKLTVRRQRHLVDVELSTHDRFVVKPRESRGDLFDFLVKLVVGYGSVDVAVLLRSGPVEVVGDEEDLQRPAAANQP